MRGHQVLICERCGSPSGLRASINGEPSVLCRSCLRGAGGTVAYADIIGGVTTVPKRLAECPVCGTKRDRIPQTGMVGCPLCYVVFEDTVRQTAPRL